MGRKTKISREMILETAYEILDESGSGAVAIKTIAARLECSTQPISWHFGSMTELRKELLFYASDKLWGNTAEELEGKSAVDAFFATGVKYITIACDHPNVFRFISVDDPIQTVGADVTGDSSIFTLQMDRIAAEMLIKEYKDLDPAKIGEAVQNTVIYTHGLAVLMMWDNFRMPKETACKMVYDMGVRLLSDAGIVVIHE